MEIRDTTATPWSFWVIVAVALVWNLLGCVNFVVQMDPEALASYRESERAIVAARPTWATAGFALGVFGGAIGCILLLLRRTAAFYLLVVSLVGVVVTTIDTLSRGIAFDMGEIVGIVAMPVVVAALLPWYTKHAERRGWLRRSEDPIAGDQ